jgi:thiamine pyrophosphate-dependent acetolactate synthase large subunit-like protein
VIDRCKAITLLLQEVRGEPIIATLGTTTFDLFLTQDRPENFYAWGSMGLATSIGLGVALARPERRVCVLEGDGSLLMNLGSLATIACEAPPNLGIIVWDNGCHALTGGQPTATSKGTSLAAIARGAGIPQVEEAASLEEFARACRRLLSARGPWVLIARTLPGTSSGRPVTDPVSIKQRFMTSLTLREKDRQRDPDEVS